MVVRLHKLFPHHVRRRINHTLCRSPYYRKYVSNRRLKKRRKHLPKPLVPRMEHQNLSSITINPSTNANCLFLTMLPLEIRLHIYKQVYNDPTFSDCMTAHIRGHLTTVPICCSRAEPVVSFPRLHLLSLPKTCRQIYIESLPYLYTLHSFLPANLATIMSLSRSLLPSRLSLIRRLKLILRICYPLVLFRDPVSNLTLDETWDILATQMTGLRDLDVCILLHSHGQEWEEAEQRVLSGLGKCKGLAAFKVRVVHWGALDGTRIVDESMEARMWREELTRRVTRPRVRAEESEDPVALGESESIGPLYEFDTGIEQARRLLGTV